MSTSDFLNSLDEKSIAELFDNLKEKYGRDIFGQGYLYKIIDDSEIADVSTLSDDEKKMVYPQRIRFMCHMTKVIRMATVGSLKRRLP